MRKLAPVILLSVLPLLLPSFSPRYAGVGDSIFNDNTSCLGTSLEPDVRMVAAQIFFVEGSSAVEIEEYLKEMKRDGINTILLRVFQNRGDRPHPIAGNKRLPGVYFQTDRAPVIYDLLGLVAEIAHRHKIKVLAWMSTRHCDWQLDHNRGWREIRFNPRSHQL